MKKIYSFSDFSSLYEADAVTPTPTEASKLYDQTLGLILTTALNAYTSELDFPIASYDANIDADVAAIKSTPVLDKPGALKTIMGKVQKAAADNKAEGAKEAIYAWVAAGSKTVDALAALINQYKDQPEELKHINDSINSKVDEFLKNLIDSSKANKLKAEVIAAKESYEFEGAEEISEAADWLKGKKGMIEDETMLYALARQDTTSRQYVSYFDKDYKGKRDYLRKFSLNPEIEFILDTVNDEAISYDTHNFFAYPAFLNLTGLKDNVVDKLNDNYKKIYDMFGFTDDITAWQYFRQFQYREFDYPKP